VRSGTCVSVMSGNAIQAVRQFAKPGMGSQVSATKEIAIGLGLGLIAGFTWKVPPCLNVCLISPLLSGNTESALYPCCGVAHCVYTKKTRFQRLLVSLQSWHLNEKRKIRWVQYRALRPQTKFRL
jgi:hypothetical protein